MGSQAGLETHRGRLKATAGQAPSPAKLTRPRLQEIYPLVRLHRRLDEAFQRGPIAWIQGPPGAGKTTLAASWLNPGDATCLWYQVDAGDRDLAGFFHYLGLAVARAAPRFRQPMPKLTPEYLSGLAIFARNFFRELARRLTSPFFLVFDNLQEVSADSRLYEILREGLEELPSGGRALLISRQHPPEVFARWRLEQRLSLLDWNDLKLSEAESHELATFLHRHLPRELPDSEIRLLHQRCDGWLAGLLLLAQGARSESSGDGSLDTAAAQQVFDYFAGEIFDRHPPEVRDFLTKTALFPFFTARMAGELTNQARSQEWIAELFRRHHFMEHGADSSSLYRFHPLFRQFLLEQGRALWPPEQREELNRRAAEILEQQGHPEEALKLFLEASDGKAVAERVCRLAPQWAADGRLATLGEAIQKVPPSGMEDAPWLSYWRGVSRAPFDLQRAHDDFEKAYEMFSKTGDTEGLYLSWVGGVESISHSLNDIGRLDRWFERFALLRQEKGSPSWEVEQRIIPVHFIALALRRPQDPELPSWRTKAADLLERRDLKPSLRILTAFYLLTHQLWTGQHAAARVTCELLVKMGGGSTTAPLAQIVARLAQSWFAWLSGEDERCVEAMREGLDLAQASGVHRWNVLLMIQGIVGALNMGDQPLAERLFERIAALLPHARGMDAFYYHHERAWQAMLQQDVPGALGYQEQALSAAERTAVVFVQAQGHFGMSQVLEERGDWPGADFHLAEARRFGTLLGSKMIEFMVRMAEAQYALERGHGSDLAAKLEEALSLGRREGYVSYSWCRSDVLSRLCAHALALGIEIDYARELIRLRKLVPPSAEPVPDSWPYPVKIYTLGGLRVMREGEPLKFSSKAQKKPLDLLKAVIALGGREVPDGRVADALWPSVPGDTAMQALATTLHRLRKLIGDSAIERGEGRLTLNRQICWVDVWALEEELAASVADPARWFALYQGPFLEEEDAKPCILSARERLRSKLLRKVEELGRSLIDGGNAAQAVKCFEHALEREPLVESLHQGVMRGYLAQGRRSEAAAAYDRCRKLLATHFRLSPSPETEELYRNIKSDPLGGSGPA